MSDPPRLLSEEDGPRDGAAPHHALKRALLRAAKADRPPAAARQQTLDALGLGDASVSASDVTSAHRATRAPAWRAPAAAARDRAPIFASFLQRGEGSPRRFGASAVASTVAHAALLALVLYGSTRAPTIRAEEPEVTWRPHAPLFAPPVGGVPPRAEAELSHDPAPRLAPETISEGPARARQAAAPAERPRERAAMAEAPAPAPVPTGADVAPQPIGAAPPPLPPAEEILPFGEGMSRPRRIDGPEPEYSQAARAAKVSGTMLVKCVITRTGALQRCQILRSLPFLEEPVLDALAKQRYTPVTFQGRTINVEYVIPLKFELP